MTAAVLAAAAAFAAGGDPAASGIPVDVAALRGHSGYGTVTLYRGNGGAAALVDLRELGASKPVRVLVQAGTCLRTGASFAALPQLRSDARGRVSGRGLVQLGAEPIPLAALTDGPHAVSVVIGGKRALCGEVRR